MKVQSLEMRLLSFDRYIFRMKFSTGFTCQNLHGFAREEHGSCLASFSFYFALLMVIRILLICNEIVNICKIIFILPCSLIDDYHPCLQLDLDWWVKQIGS